MSIQLQWTLKYRLVMQRMCLLVVHKDVVYVHSLSCVFRPWIQAGRTSMLHLWIRSAPSVRPWRVGSMLILYMWWLYTAGWAFTSCVVSAVFQFFVENVALIPQIGPHCNYFVITHFLSPFSLKPLEDSHLNYISITLNKKQLEIIKNKPVCFTITGVV